MVGPEDHTLQRYHLPQLTAGGVNALVLALYVEPYFREAMLRETLLMIDDLHEEIAESDGAIGCLSGRARTSIDRARRSTCCCRSREWSRWPRTWAYCACSSHSVCVRWATWFGRTMAADGSGEAETGGGLTRFGREVVRECNRLGILVDVSHLSERGFWDVLAIAQGPVIASHSNARAVSEHHRNLTDEQLRAIAETGGCVGLNAYRPFVDEERARQTLDWLLDHGDHMAGVMGPGNVRWGWICWSTIRGSREPRSKGCAIIRSCRLSRRGCWSAEPAGTRYGASWARTGCASGARYCRARGEGESMVVSIPSGLRCSSKEGQKCPKECPVTCVS